jgi:hypothetical protein
MQSFLLLVKKLTLLPASCGKFLSLTYTINEQVVLTHNAFVASDDQYETSNDMRNKPPLLIEKPPFHLIN